MVQWSRPLVPGTLAIAMRLLVMDTLATATRPLVTGTLYTTGSLLSRKRN